MDERKHGSFSSGFVWGLVVGILLSALVGTKRGRELLKELSERGLSAIEDFLENQENTLEDEVMEMGEQDAGEVEVEEKKDEEAPIPSAEPEPEDEAEVKPKPEPTVKPANGSLKKRVFRGIRRK